MCLGCGEGGAQDAGPWTAKWESNDKRHLQLEVPPSPPPLHIRTISSETMLSPLPHSVTLLHPVHGLATERSSIFRSVRKEP